MKYPSRLEAYSNLVEKRFSIYNGLFLSLPFEGVTFTGESLPILNNACVEGMNKGESPLQIITKFLENMPSQPSEKEKVKYLFNVIQYIERQIVLFDSVEDAAFPVISKLSKNYSVKELFNYLRSGSRIEDLKEKLRAFSIRLVFTAHPTQFYPPAVLDIIADLRRLVKVNDISEIDKRIQQLGLTSFIKKSKPTPIEEAENIIYYLRNIYYDAIGEYYSQLKGDLLKHEDFLNPDLMKIGFWPGGDRDGNPFVTADTTRQVADKLRMTLMKCYYQDIKALEKKLTFREVSEPLRQLKQKIYESMFDNTALVSYQEIIDPLLEMETLIEQRYNSLYILDLQNLIDKVRIFKTHFATLDIRQDHRKHKAAVESILQHNNLLKGSIDDLSSEDLLNLLDSDIPIPSSSDYQDPITADTIKNISQLSTIQKINGEPGCNRYIISNSEDIFSVLFVYKLFIWCGWKEENLTFDIVPLFETMEGMTNAESVMRHLFSMEFYNNHISRRGNKQTMMLGFSDGTKDGGYLRANWEIFKTKEILTKVCNDHQVDAVFFDGRGGPPARGGGKTHRFYASLGETIANNEIQLTVQGQTITSTFGSKEQFLFNSEQMLTAGLRNELAEIDEPQFSPKQRQFIEQLAELSFAKYDKLKKHDMFIPYLEQMSTLKYYSNANIGSRPGKRGNTKQLTLDDLRAISFVGSWSQLKQNVPGYFGIGTAINAMKQQGRMQEVKDLYNSVPFFKALLLNSMMSLTKSNFPLTSYMSKDQKYGSFWKVLHEEYLLSKEMMLEVSGQELLMQEEPISRASIQIREQIVLPLLVIQQYALQKIAAGDGGDVEVYKKMVTRSLYGNINASRNSA